jgi:hypothetical protein
MSKAHAHHHGSVAYHACLFSFETASCSRADVRCALPFLSLSSRAAASEREAQKPSRAWRMRSSVRLQAR